MILKSYQEFINLSINERLDKSKKFLKDTYLIKRAADELDLITPDISNKLKSGEKKVVLMSDFDSESREKIKLKLRDLKLSDSELSRIERNEDLEKIKNLLANDPGYIYNFTYMYFVEMTPFQELENIYKDLVSLKPILNNLKDIEEVGRNFDLNFIDESIPNDRESRTNSEIIIDGIEKLKEYRSVKKIIDTLPKKLREEYKSAPVLIKNDIANIAKGFEDIPDTPIEGEDITKRERDWKNFFGEMKLDTYEKLPNGESNPNFGKLRFKSRLFQIQNLREFVGAATKYLSSIGNDGLADKLDKIEKCNDKFGKMGCDVIFNDNNILILQINSFPANQFLNSHTTHCIVNYKSNWDSYLGEYNKQYYLYNFNLPKTDELSTIGVTIKPDGSWTSGACQSSRNNSIGNRFKEILKNWEKDWGLDVKLLDYLKPMTKEEIAIRERAKKSEIELVKKGITIDQIRKYVTEDGADINKDKARALINAVEEGDIKKVEYCLSLGSSPNLAQGPDSAIGKAKDVDTIKLLVKYGSDIPNDVFENIMDDLDALEYCLKAGLDPNYGNSMPFRKILSKKGESNLEAFKLVLKYGGTIRDGRGGNIILKWSSQYSKYNILDYLRDNGYFAKFLEKDWLDSISWILTSTRDSETDTKLEYLIRNYIEFQKPDLEDFKNKIKKYGEKYAKVVFDILDKIESD
jgi:hypothetical protein